MGATVADSKSHWTSISELFWWFGSDFQLWYLVLRLDCCLGDGCCRIIQRFSDGYPCVPNKCLGTLSFFEKNPARKLLLGTLRLLYFPIFMKKLGFYGVTKNFLLSNRMLIWSRTFINFAVTRTLIWPGRLFGSEE